MTRCVVRTKAVPEPSGCYSQAVRAGNLVFLSGQVGIVALSGRLVPVGIRPQIRQTLENIGAILAEVGGCLDDVVRVNAYLRRIRDFEVYDEVYSEYFESDDAPARTTIEVGDFQGDMAVEIDVIAHIPES